jgi:2-(1,2-epoxy-1,2-dihydrophenyl)acetyl-CoA isomerase
MAVSWRRQKMSENDEILINFEEGIKTLTINLPKKLNALSAANALRMAKEVEKSEEDGTRVVVITGAGGAFCAGADLAQRGFEKLGQQGAPTEQQLDELVATSYHRLSSSVYRIPRPVIAAVDGVAAGFGCSLALNADITLASTQVRFIEVFINIALIPDGGSTYILPKLVGLKKALEMAFTGEPVHAEEALRLNMVNRVYPPEELMEKALEWARKLAKGPVRSMGIAKRTFYEAYLMNSDQALDMESRRQARLMTQSDFVNAVLAFHEKKEPTFS